MHLFLVIHQSSKVKRQDKDRNNHTLATLLSHCALQSTTSPTSYTIAHRLVGAICSPYDLRMLIQFEACLSLSFQMASSSAHTHHKAASLLQQQVSFDVYDNATLVAQDFCARHAVIDCSHVVLAIQARIDATDPLQTRFDPTRPFAVSVCVCMSGP